MALRITEPESDSGSCTKGTGFSRGDVQTFSVRCPALSEVREERMAFGFFVVFVAVAVQLSVLRAVVCLGIACHGASGLFRLTVSAGL